MSALWVSTILDAATRATVLMSIAAVLSLMLRHRTAELRHLVWCVALTGALVLPAVSVMLPALRVPVPQAVADSVARVAPVAMPVRRGPSAPSSRPSHRSHGLDARDAIGERESDRGTAIPTPAASPRATAVPAVNGFAWGTVPWPGVLVAVWIFGVVLIGARALVGRWRAARLAGRADDMASPEWQSLLHTICSDLGIRRPVRLVRAPWASVPMTWGWWRPIVLVAPDAEHWSPERRLLVLRHELVHVKRGDYVTQFLGQAAVALYWFHPLVWFAARRLRVERERACDDAVLTLGTRASTYARHLLDIASSIHANPVGASTSIPMARRSQLEGRLMAILDPHIRRVAARATAAVVVALLVTLALAVSIVTPDAQTADATAGPARVGLTAEEELARSAIVAQADQNRARARQEAAAADRQRVAEELAGRRLDIERRVRVGLEKADIEFDDVDINELDINLNAIASEAEALGREMARRFGQRGFGRDDDDDDDPALDPRLVAAFIGALSDSDAGVREEAVSALGRHRVREAESPLIGALSDEEAEVREEAAEALGKIRSPDGIDALVAALDDSEENVREEAAEALGRIRDPRATDGLIAALDGAQGDALEEIVGALGRIGGDRAMDALVSLMDSADDGVRREAIGALSRGNWQRNRPNPGAGPAPSPNPQR